MKQPRRDPVPARPARDGVIAALAGVGFLLAGYLTVTKLTGAGALLCTAGGGCDVVQASRYSAFLGLPTAAWGVAVYLVVGLLAILGLSPRRWLVAFLLVVAGVAFAAYLTYLELFVIKAVCWYCVGSAIVVGALCVALLARKPPVTGKRSPIRPRRVATLAGLVAVVTLLGGVAGFELAAISQDSAGFQDALARHLASSGAVMYGAVW